MSSGSIALVGNPNVGKSILFHRLTGHYAMVSNYPGTTVEITQGTAQALPRWRSWTPPASVASRRAARMSASPPRCCSATRCRPSCRWATPKTCAAPCSWPLQIAEMGVPQVLALNMVDEAHARGLTVDAASIAAALGIAVIPTVATRGQGLKPLLQSPCGAPRRPVSAWPTPPRWKTAWRASSLCCPPRPFARARWGCCG